MKCEFTLSPATNLSSYIHLARAL